LQVTRPYQHPIGGGYSPKYVERANADRDRPDESKAAIFDRKERFEQFNRLARAHGDAWLISIPGVNEITFECLPGSAFPARLEALDYRLRDEGRGQRILAHAITERFCRAADGTVVPITEGSTMPVVHRVAHAGIITVQRYSFWL
jgi:hypothetical protein